jgi:hypothetical protein
MPRAEFKSTVPYSSDPKLDAPYSYADHSHRDSPLTVTTTTTTTTTTIHHGFSFQI